MTANRRAGMTLVEIAIALTILALLTVNATMVARTGSKVATSGVFLSTLNDERDLTLDRITLALMGASADEVYPRMVAPASTEQVNYSVSLGLEDGEIVYGPPERIGWYPTPQGGRVAWSQNPTTPEERVVVWSNSVPSLHKGEVENGLDDNQNSVNDERGLAFVQAGSLMQVMLTVERVDPDGKVVAVERLKQVSCRN